MSWRAPAQDAWRSFCSWRGAPSHARRLPHTGSRRGYTRVVGSSILGLAEYSWSVPSNIAFWICDRALQPFADLATLSSLLLTPRFTRAATRCTPTTNRSGVADSVCPVPFVYDGELRYVRVVTNSPRHAISLRGYSVWMSRSLFAFGPPVELRPGL
jgi:hypothetical protein